MSNLIQSKGAAWAAILLVTAVLVLQFCLGPQPWWDFIPVFFAFLMSFFHLIAVYMRKASAISRQLDFWAMIFGIAMIAAIIGIYIAGEVMFDL